jgi:hypothetical protein
MIKKQFSNYQLSRLADLGYWVHTIGNYVDVTCISSVSVKLCRSMSPTADWHTLMWACAPTKKASQEEPGYQHYPSHADMITAHPEFTHKIPAACTPAPNDEGW